MTDNANPIERLRGARGDQDVKFSQVADHLRDYLDGHPQDAAAVGRIADFLTDVERVDHDHDADPVRGLG